MLTYIDFTYYSYENGHQGVYPLDTNDEGILARLHGSYGSLSYPANALERSRPDENEEQDKRKKKLHDRDFLKLQAAS